MAELLFSRISHELIGACFEVYNGLQAGLPEAVCQKALETELDCRGVLFEAQKRFPVRYKGTLVGDFYADLAVEGKIIVELKSVPALKEVFRRQVLNYLQISGFRVGYLVNFWGLQVEFERFVI